MLSARGLLARARLRHVLFAVLLLAGILPLAVSSWLLVRQNRQVLRDEQRDRLIDSALALSRQLDVELLALQRQLALLGDAVLAPPAGGAPAARLRAPWVGRQLQRFAAATPGVLDLRVLDRDGAGPRFTAEDGGPAALAALDGAFAAARGGDDPVYRFVDLPQGPAAVLAVPAAGPDGRARLVVEALFVLRPIQELIAGEVAGGVEVFLVDRGGRLLWSQAGGGEAARALLASDVVRAFVARPLGMTTQYASGRGGGTEMLAQVSPVEASGWGVVAQQSVSEAFEPVDRMIGNAAIAAVPLVVLAFGFAYWVSHRVGEPIQRLAATSSQIAAGSFGGRVESRGLAFELSDLAANFNRMSGQVASHVQQLRDAAQANRDLFIGSLRAFAAAIDAKDPYTRGHSDRVAALSRILARHLGLPEEVQHKVWIGALLHDVGKIGIEDRILTKAGVLSPEEYEQMKLHTIKGAEILSPIEQLREVLPAVRWHHEAWNGRGYPDGLKGEQIPLLARIVAVADCFDAITTNRPYQQAYSLKFAVETITKLTGSRFDAKVVTAFLRAFEAGEVRMPAPRPASQPAQPLQAKAS
ncbi:MAG TPA: HD domain-containing phosphohydrolase [Thermoanaerobaculia bacterium]|nr:HD domain-containing phosphohydrolase [Thermoanaerobaculia bacterium]